MPEREILGDPVVDLEGELVTDKLAARDRDEGIEGSADDEGEKEGDREGDPEGD